MFSHMLLHLDMCFTKMLKARNKHSFSEVIFNLCWDFYSRPKHTFFSFEILAYLKCSMLVLMKVPRGRKNRYNFPHLAWKKMSASLFHDYYATISIYILIVNTLWHSFHISFPPSNWGIIERNFESLFTLKLSEYIEAF